MKQLTTLAICSMIYLTSFAQSITTVEDVYGGRINAITGGQFGSTDSFRIVVSTESANTLFYATGNFPTTGIASVGTFTAFPSANATAGYGSSVSKIAYHATSGTTYFIASGDIYSTSTTATSATKLTTSGNYIDIKISGSNFFSLTSTGTNNSIYYSTISSTGALTASSSASLLGGSYTNIVIGGNDYLYLFSGSTTDPAAVRFSNTITVGVNLGVTTTDAMGSLSTSYTWAAMGVYTDGTVFVGGTNGGTSPYKYVAKASSFGTVYTTVSTGISGTSGTNIEFRRASATSYYVYFGTAYSNSKGAASSWNTFGNSGMDSHPNDGTVTFFREGGSGGILLLTSDLGLAWTKNSGSVMADINDGILATQVEDFDMNSSKTFGWLAAKDGIRYVNNYNTSSKAWTTSMWPGGDGSPYYSSEMAGNDTNKAYVGNVRIYKTSNKGSSWTQVFTPEDAPYSFPSVGVEARAIAVYDNDTSMVMAGFNNTNSGQYGGVFYSTDGGKNWSQLLINATTSGQDVNVNDIEMVYDSGKVVAYIGVDYINSTVRGMYKAQWNGSSWSVSREEIYSASTSKFSISDIVIASKDTIAAVGSFYNPVLGRTYPIYFNISRTVMNDWRSTVVDTNRNGEYTACAWNHDTMYYAYGDTIFYDIISFHSTSTSRVGEATYSVIDNGTEINVLYYDELLCGSTTGFRSIKGASSTYSALSLPTISISANKTAICPGQNVTFTSLVSNASSPTYTWKVNGTIMGGNNYTFTTNALPNNASVTCTVSSNGKTASSNSISITVYGTPFINPITGTLVSCKIGGTSYVSDNTAGGVWNSSNNAVATIDANGKIISVGNGATNISYKVTTLNGCSNTMFAVYRVSPVPAPANITGVSSLCKGATTTLVCNSGGGLWSSLNNAATINANTGLLIAANTGTASIKYTVTNADGCSNNSDYSLIINQIPNIPTINYSVGSSNPQNGAGGNNNFCKNKTFTLVGNPAGGVWTSTNSNVVSVNNTGVTNTVNTGTATVSYTITVNGCNSSKSITGTVVNCAGAKGINGNTNLTENQKIEFGMYPNPAKGFVNIVMQSASTPGTIRITDLYGKQVKTQNLSLGNNTVGLQGLAKGIYIISVESRELIKSQKLIIE